MKFSVVTPLWQDRPAAENLEVAIAADRLGYPELWIGEMATYDAFAFATAVGYNTQRIALSIGPLAVGVRTPMTMAMGIASVADLTGRPTGLALGASSNVVVEHWHGRARARTATQLDETAQIVRGLLAGEKVDFSGETASCRGYRLRLAAVNGPLTVAAFGPAAVRVAARRADRMLLNMVTPASLGRLRGDLAAAAEAAGRPVPKVAVWLSCAVDPEPAAIQQLLQAIVGYLAKVGVKAKLIQLQYSAMREKFQGGKVQLAFWTWGSNSINDISAIIDYWFMHTTDDVARDPKVLELLTAAGGEMNVEKRKSLYKEALQIIASQAYTVPLFTWVSNYCFSSELDFTPHSDETPRFYSAKWK